MADAVWFAAAMTRMDHLETLGPDWDGNGGRPPTGPAQTAARGYLSVLALITPISAVPEPAIVPTPDGGVQLEWHQGGADVEVYVDPDGTITGWTSDGTTEATFG